MGKKTGRIHENAIPRSSDCVQKSNGCWNMNNSPYRNANFWNQDGCWNYDTVEGKGDNVGYDLPHEEEAIEHIKLLP